ncbi:MAG TPA: tetratricopeptide repeat protein [Chthonomonadaceae bacterium]|nr:tetratricopeptide repeat protein [Chthonomonadaceae bacterium]
MSSRAHSLVPILCAVSLSVGLGSLPSPAASQAITTGNPQAPTASPSPVQQELDRLFQEGGQALAQGKFAAAEKAFQAGWARAQAAGNQSRVAAFLNALGNVYFQQNQFPKALDYYGRALTLREQRGSPSDIAHSLNNLGYACYQLGLLERAVKLYQRAVEIEEKLENPAERAYMLDALGSVYESLGQFDKALECADRALALQEELADTQAMASSYNSLGNIYNNLGQYQRALDYHNRAMALLEKAGDAQRIGVSQTNLGNVYANMGQFEKAVDAYRRALKLFEKSGDTQNAAYALGNLGNVYFNQNQFEKAQEYYRRALALKEPLGNRQDIAQSLNNLGSVYDGQGQSQQALDCYTRALALFEQVGNRQELATALSNLGRLYERLGQPERAEGCYRQAIQHYEAVGQQIGDPGRMGAFQQANQGNLYARYAALLLTRRPEQALAVIERGRGQGLARQARQSRTPLERLLKPADARRLKALSEAALLADDLLQALLNQDLPADAADQQRLAQQILQARERRRQAENEAARFRDGLFARPEYGAYRRLAGFQYSTPADLKRLAQRRRDTLFLEWAVVDARTTLLFALSRSGMHAFRLPIGADRLTPMAANWRTAILSRHPTEPQHAHALYAALLAPLEKAGLLRAGRYHHLVLVADGPLLSIPFAALLDGSGRRLAERFPLASAISLGTLTWPSSKARPHATLLCVVPTEAGAQRFARRMRSMAGTLPYARAEGRAIAAMFPHARILEGAAAKEREVKRLMGRYALLHFAAHGYANASNGLRSFLALAAGEGEDGVLEAQEVAEIPLMARLAVLSACETAQGQPSGGEGLLGLVWAFRAASCPSIVASQWKVEDAATARLMVAFYRALKAGRPKDAALRQAMLLVKREKAAPYYWAAFQVIGETRPLFFR